MDSRSVISTLLIIILLLHNFNTKAFAAQSRIFLHIKDLGTQPPCPRLMEQALKELRELEPQSVIMVDAKSDAAEQSLVDDSEDYDMSCEPQSQTVMLQKQKTDTSYKLRYKEQANEFDASDWLPFQKRRQIVLAPREREEPGNPSKLSHTPNPLLVHETTPIYRRGWFWIAATSVVAASVAAILVSNNSGTGSATVRVK